MRNLVLFLFILFGLNANAQTYKFYQTKNIHNQFENRYMLYETKNIWTFILLDRCTGKLWQCQYSVKSVDEMITVVINNKILSNSDKPIFTIEPLVSMYQFYLINESNGDMWKFQWSTSGDDYRWIEKI